MFYVVYVCLRCLRALNNGPVISGRVSEREYQYERCYWIDEDKMPFQCTYEKFLRQ